MDNELDKVEYGHSMRIGALTLESKFQYDETVYFIENHSIHYGKCIGIKGENSTNRNDVEVLVYVSYGEVAAQFWVNELYCFHTQEELIKSLTGV